MSQVTKPQSRHHTEEKGTAHNLTKQEYSSSWFLSKVCTNGEDDVKEVFRPGVGLGVMDG